MLKNKKQSIESQGYERYLKYIQFADKTDVFAEYLEKNIIKALSENKKVVNVLDIGGGTGRIVKFLLKFADCHQCDFVITVLEPADNAGNNLFKLFERFKNVRVVKDNLQNWSIDNNEVFDLIIASHVMYYFKDRQQFVRLCLDRLRKGGRLVMAATSLTILENDLYQNILPTFRKKSSLPKTDKYDGSFGFAEELELILFHLGVTYHADSLPSKLFIPVSAIQNAFAALEIKEAASQEFFQVISFLWHYPPEVLTEKVDLWREYLSPLTKRVDGLNIHYEDKVITIKS